MEKEMTAKEALDTARAIVLAMKCGQISYDKAKAQCLPLFEIAYRKACEIAKKYGKRASKIDFATFAR